MFAPEKGRDNPEIRRALDLCTNAGFQVTYHEDTLEVRYGLNNKRFYTLWPNFLGDVRAIFGERMDELGAEEAVAAARTAGRRATRPAAAPALSQADQLRALRAEVKRLERALRAASLQSEEWKREAEHLRQQLDSTRTDIRQVAEARAALLGGDRYKQVRQIIVRRLHPDVFGTADEKRYREALFKTIWAEIEQLDKNRA